MQSSQQSNGKTGDWAFPNSRNVSFTYPLKCNSTVAVIPMCRLNSPTSDNPAINMGAFYRAATGAGFIHYSSISWEQTVTWYACYVAFCVQQWGSYGSTAITVTFPVSFSSAVYSVVANPNTTSGYNEDMVAGNWTLTTCYFRIANKRYNQAGNYIVIGK